MMSWMVFAMWMLGIYFFYYAVNIGFDLIRMGKTVNILEDTVVSVKVDQEEDIVLPLKVDDGDEIDYFIDEEDTPVPESPIYASSGVGLKELFELARSESIEFTGKVKY